MSVEGVVLQLPRGLTDRLSAPSGTEDLNDDIYVYATNVSKQGTAGGDASSDGGEPGEDLPPVAGHIGRGLAPSVAPSSASISLYLDSASRSFSS